MTDLSIVADDPFSPVPPDEVAELGALRNAIELANGFTLLFACCNHAGRRDHLMAKLQAELSGRRAQFLALREPVRNLLEVLRVSLDSPPPNVLFLYGIEDWLPFGDEAGADPFVLNLNAARNHFPREVPCPVVFWIPQHILTTLARSAPDFCSVRSGLYLFSATPEVQNGIAESLTSHDITGLAGLAYHEKVERAEALAAMLAEYVALPSELRDLNAEARLLDSLASIQYVLGHFKVAEPLHRRALEIREAALGSDHPDTAKSLNSLANLYRSQGRLAEAEPLYHRSLEIREAALGSDHPDTAKSLNSLANLYYFQGRLAESESLYRRSLEIRETALGPDHPDTAMSLNNLANLYASQGRLAEAEPLQRRAFEIREAALGSDHPDTAASLNNLANLYASQGRLAEAEPLFRKALEIHEARLGLAHPDIAASLNNLAFLYASQGRLAEAEPLYHRGLEIYEAALGPDHPDSIKSLENYASLLMAKAAAARARRDAKASDKATSE